MSDGVDVVVTLHALATYAESANHWTDDKRMMEASGVADTIYEAMDRIEELEVKLAKAVEALGSLIQQTHNCEKELTEELHHQDFCGESLPLTNARATLAELTGGKDE